MLGVWVTHRRTEGYGQTAPVLPIVLYNGDRRWRAPVGIAKLIDPMPSLGKYALHFEYFKIAENDFSREQLLGMHNIVSTLFLTESHYDFDLVMTEFLGLFEHEEDRQAISLFLNWFRQLSVYGRVRPEEYAAVETTYRSVEEARTMLIAALEKEREDIRNEGIDQGIENERRDIVRSMRVKDFDLTIIADVVGLTMEQVNELLADDNGAAKV